MLGLFPNSAWTNAAVNAATANFYTATLDTIESSWVRPRGDGFIGFQQAGSAIVRDVVSGELTIDQGLRTLRARSNQEAAPCHQP